MRLSPLLLPILAAASLHAAAPAQTWPVWPDGVQGPIPDKGPERESPPVPNAKVVQRIEGVVEPSLMVYPAKPEMNTGVAVIICPGGGFAKLALDLEGTEVAENLNAIGISAFVLKYRTAPKGTTDPQAGPAMDAQRAVSIVRSRAAEFGINAERIGLLGISAGGQTALIATSNHAHRLYEARAKWDEVSCRPDFLALVYPWHILDDADQTKSHLRPDIHIDQTMPPVFIAQAADDPGALVEGSVTLFQQLHAAKIPAELHAYVKGGHGFGLRPAEAPTPTDWPKRLADWLTVTGLLKH